MDQRPQTTHEREPMLPLDERFRQAEQYSFDFPKTKPAAAKDFPEQTCGRLGYCYCPKCNPR